MHAVPLVGILSVVLCRFDFRFVQFLHSWISMLPMINVQFESSFYRKNHGEKLDNQLEKMNFTFTERVCGRWWGFCLFLKEIVFVFCKLILHSAGAVIFSLQFTTGV